MTCSDERGEHRRSVPPSPWIRVRLGDETCNGRRKASVNSFIAYIPHRRRLIQANHLRLATSSPLYKARGYPDVAYVHDRRCKSPVPGNSIRISARKSSKPRVGKDKKCRRSVAQLVSVSVVLRTAISSTPEHCQRTGNERVCCGHTSVVWGPNAGPSYLVVAGRQTQVTRVFDGRCAG